MSRRVRHGSGGAGDEFGGDDWDLAEGLDPEGPSAADLDRYGDELVSCIHCGARIYDQAELCPRCGAIQEEVERTVAWWMYAVVILLVGLLLMFVF